MEQLTVKGRLINETQAAEILGRAVQTLRNDRHLRKGPAYLKLGWWNKINPNFKHLHNMVYQPPIFQYQLF